jgi:tight adherence protein B
MASEMRRVVTDEQLGVPLERALNAVATRMSNRDLSQVALVAVLQRETGGNGAEALDRVVENIRARDDLRRLLRTLTAQGKIAQRVLTGLPIATLTGMTLLAGDAMRPLYHTFAGFATLAVASVFIVAGALWVRKVVNVEA